MEVGDGQRLLAPHSGPVDGPLNVTVRPERIKLDAPDDASWSRLSGAVVEIVYLGSMTQLIVELSFGERLVVHLLNDDEAGRNARAGDVVTLGWPAEATYVLGSGAPATSPATEYVA